MPILLLVLTFVHSLFKSQRLLILENLALRQQVAMLRRSVRRPRVSAADRLFWILFQDMSTDGVRYCMPCIRIRLYAGIGRDFVFIGVGRVEGLHRDDRR
jgi:hypothetical protein